ncbi:MAG: hypothetical protein Rubg2KO_07770 [Rubricoccaceae bacterium]
MNVFGAHPEWFGPLYGLAYLVAYLVAGWVGYRRGWPLTAWLLVLAAAGIGGIVGTRLLPLGIEGLQTLFATGALPETTTKRIPGTVAGALALAIGTRWVLGLRHSVLDPFAYAGLAMLAVARVGCLIAGCCFGTPIDLPWGVTYAEGSFAHGFHLAHGIVEAGASAPHAVHAIPLYDIVFALVGLALLPALSRRLRAPGSLCWTTLGVYALYRFAQDFIRANEVTVAGDLTTIQILGLATSVLALGGVAVRERRARRQPDALLDLAEPTFARLALVFLALLAMRAGLDGWLTGLEDAVIAVRLLPAGIALAVLAWQHLAAPQVRWTATALAGGLPLVLGFQLAPPDSASPRFSFLAVDAHATRGQYEDQDICSSALYAYQTGGVGIAHVTVDPDRAFSREVGLRVYGGTQERVDLDPSRIDPSAQLSILGAAPYVQVEGDAVGGHIGVHVGRIPFLGGDDEDNPGILPSFGVRLGPRHAHAHFGVLDGAQFGTPAPAMRIGLGTGWLTERGQEARVQVGTSPSGVYGLATLPVQQVTFEPMVAFGQAGDFFHTGLRVRYQMQASRPPVRIPALPDSLLGRPPSDASSKPQPDNPDTSADSLNWAPR